MWLINYLWSDDYGWWSVWWLCSCGVSCVLGLGKWLRSERNECGRSLVIFWLFCVYLSLSDQETTQQMPCNRRQSQRQGDQRISALSLTHSSLSCTHSSCLSLISLTHSNTMSLSLAFSVVTSNWNSFLFISISSLSSLWLFSLFWSCEILAWRSQTILIISSKNHKKDPENLSEPVSTVSRISGR